MLASEHTEIEKESFDGDVIPLVLWFTFLWLTRRKPERFSFCESAFLSPLHSGGCIVVPIGPIYVQIVLLVF
jgi:hypothetical protein